jgi:mono/diheme cytochrome c family protein
MTARPMVSAAAGVLLVALAAACGSARRSEPLAGAFVPPGPHEAQGERVYMANCQPCHPGGETGLGPALNDKPLPGFMIAFQTRHGFGAMPAFGPDEISDAELDAVIAYLKARRGG